MRFRSRVGKFMVFTVVAISAMGWAVMTLWNWLLPSLWAGARDIDFLHAVALLVLTRILVGGMGHGGRTWRSRRWEHMTAEEREALRTRMSGCHGKGRHEAAP